jgi:tRNA pseudouridine38-40 synthase
VSRAPRRLALLIAYRGDAFHGFQRQAGAPTVQQALEEAWSAVSGESAVLHGSGRTDAGVHAWGQVAHFSTFSALPPRGVRDALNAYLPAEIAVRAAAEVGPEFHARASALWKHYVYRLAVAPVRPVLAHDFAHWERGPLDLAAMRAAARLLIGRRDFRAFAAAGRPVRDPVRTLHDLRLVPTRGGLLLHARGDGFLYRMVRNLAGVLLEIGRGRRAPEWAAAVLASGDRRRGGATAPAAGLLLWRVRYARDPFALSRPEARAYPFDRPAASVPRPAPPPRP